VVPSVVRKRGSRQRARSVSKLDLAVIVASIAGALLWIEHGHRVGTDAPTSAELEARAGASACPESENMPYTARCLAFLKGSTASEMHGLPNVAETAPARHSAAATGHELTPVSAQACAENDTAPYAASCIAFMSGWFWRPDTP
jgi:hypothetical protein